MELPDPKRIAELVGLLAPGFVLLWASTRVHVGPSQSLQERFIGYAIASAAYYAGISPFFSVSQGVQLPSLLWGLLHYFVVPGFIGYGLAWTSQRELQYRFARKLGLNFTHHIPAAWDFTFSRLKASTFVLVTLADGSQISGLVGEASFASSSRDERDLLLEEVFTVTDIGSWEPSSPSRSILIAGKDIRTVEIFRREDHG